MTARASINIATANIIIGVMYDTAAPLFFARDFDFGGDGFFSGIDFLPPFMFERAILCRRSEYEIKQDDYSEDYTVPAESLEIMLSDISEEEFDYYNGNEI